MFIQNTTDISGNLMYKPVKLPAKDAGNIKKVTSLMLDILRQNRRLWRKEITDWQRARQARYSRDYPKNYLLQEVYDDIMLDGQLTGITQNRTFRTTNKDYIFVNPEGGKDDACTAFIKDKRWFETFIQHAHETAYFGTQVVWIKEFDKAEIKAVDILPRYNVVPETKMFLPDITSDKGISYPDFPNYLIEVQMYDAVGLLEKAAPYTILKRHSWGSWDEFEELFGVPIRIAKIASQSETVKKEVAGWLEEMGSAPYGVFPIGTDVQIVENSKTDAFNVFYQKIKAIQEELSILVLHQTMTTENGSSKAQGTVHENTLSELVFADEKKILSILNDSLVPAMRFFGYKIPDGFRIAVAQTKDPQEQIKIDGVFLQSGYVLPKDYITEVYGTEIESMPVQNPAQYSKAQAAKKD